MTIIYLLKKYDIFGGSIKWQPDGSVGAGVIGKVIYWDAMHLKYSRIDGN